MTEPTLHQALAAVGWRSEPLPPDSVCQGRFVFDEAGQPLGAMTAGDVWKMLRERGLVLGCQCAGGEYGGHDLDCEVRP